MNRLLFALLLTLSACSSNPVKDEGSSPEVAATEVSSEPTKEALKPVAVPDEPVRPSVPAAPNQHAALNEAIKSQNDDRLYQAATQILLQTPNDMRALNALAMFHYKKARYDLSRYLLNKAITNHPKTAELYSNLGIVQLAQNERREAVKSFRKALEVNNNEAVAASNLGAIYVQEKDYNKAATVLETAYRRGVRDVRVLNNFAIALTAQKKFSRAEDMYKLAVKDEGNVNKEGLYNYATLLIEHMGKNQQGLDILNRLKFVGGPAGTENRIIALENKAKAGLK